MPSGYHSQRLCAYERKIDKDDSDSPLYHCKSIAVTGSMYCRHHCGLSKVNREKRKLETRSAREIAPISAFNKPRYEPSATTVKEYYRSNMQSPGILNLRNEVALLQARLQELLEAPISKLELQLQVIDRIEKLINTITRLELSAQAMKKAEEKVSLVINKIAIVINTTVKDRDTRRAIAKALLESGINTETSVINTPAQAESEQAEAEPEPAEAEQETAERINTSLAQEQSINTGSVQAGEEIGRGGQGQMEIEDIPPLSASTFSEIPTTDLPEVSLGDTPKEEEPKNI
jgi:hypothetical protein